MSTTRKGTKALMLALIVAAFAFVYVGNAQSVSAAGKDARYVVEFTYNGSQYVMDGDTELPLSTVLDYIGLTGKVSAVKGSNDNLFSFEKKNGEWFVIAHNPFNTTEWMKVTIDGAVYDVVVTDATYYGTPKVTINANGGSYSGTNPLYSMQEAASTEKLVNSNIDFPTASECTRSGYLLRGFATSPTGEPTVKPGGYRHYDIKCRQSSPATAQANPYISETYYAIWTPSSGVYRDVNWSVSTSGVLSIGAAGQTQTFAYKGTESADSWPWNICCSYITGVEFLGDVNGNGSHQGMFSGMNNRSLTGITYLSRFDTSNVTNMREMFNDCSYLTSLDLSNFNTSNVTSMNSMFYYCQNLTSLDVSGFNTSNVTDMVYMFQNCRNLTSLDLSSFDTSKVTSMNSMFSSCSKLETIYVSSLWSVSNVTGSSSMFSGCSKIVGGKGTTFNYSYTNKSRAIIDGGTSNPGYLTYKTMLKSDTATITGIEFDRITVNNGEATFVKSLKSGQWFGIFGLGKEARYTVTEAGKENYEPSYKVSEGADGVQKPKDRNDEGQSLSNE